MTDTTQLDTSISDDALLDVVPNASGDDESSANTDNSSRKIAKPKKGNRLADYLHDLREENKEYRLKYEEMSKKAEEAQSKANETNNKVEHLSKSYEQRIINAEVRAAAVEAGIIDLDDVRLANLNEVKLTDDGEVQGARAVIESLKTKKPHLFKTSSTSFTDGVPAADKVPTVDAMTLSDEEFKKLAGGKIFK
jgi:hypothetical protein